jgi:hypothetical protein
MQINNENHKFFTILRPLVKLSDEKINEVLFNIEKKWTLEMSRASDIGQQQMVKIECIKLLRSLCTGLDGFPLKLKDAKHVIDVTFDRSRLTSIQNHNTLVKSQLKDLVKVARERGMSEAVEWLNYSLNTFF